MDAELEEPKDDAIIVMLILFLMYRFRLSRQILTRLDARKKAEWTDNSRLRLILIEIS